MTATLPDVTPRKKPASSPELDAAKELVRLAKEQGLALTGPDGLLKALTKTVLETALNEELTEHLGYDKHAPEGRNRGNSRNGTRTKTVLTDNCGPVEVTVPRDRDGSFEPRLVKKRQRRLSDLDELVLSLYAKGLTTGEICAHLAEVYGASVSKDTISRITDRVIEEMQSWWARPLERVYAAIGVDLCECYGQSETAGIILCNPAGAARPVTNGLPLPGVEARIADDGELLLKGPMVMKGYRGKPDLTAEAFDPDGWLRTGDIFVQDEAGYYRIVDRKKEILVSSTGKNVSPVLVENTATTGRPRHSSGGAPARGAGSQRSWRGEWCRG